MTEFAAMNPKSCTYLTDEGDENKKAKDTKKCAIKRKLEYEHCKHCLKAAQLENENKPTKNNKVDVDSFIENYKELQWTIQEKKNELILKSQQGFRSEKYNVFSVEVNKIAFSAKDGKLTQSNHFNSNICIWIEQRSST